MADKEKRIKWIKILATKYLPELAVFSFKIPIEEKEEGIGIAATDGKRIFFSKEFWKRKEEEQVFIFLHEILHIVLNHPVRKKHREHKLWNISTDLVINQILSKFLKVPNDAITYEKIKKIVPDLDEGDSAEVAYEKLKLKQNNVEVDLFDEVLEGGGCDNGVDEMERKMVLMGLKEKLKSIGKDAGVLELEIEELFGKRKTPKLELSEELTHQLADDYTNKISRRHYHIFKKFNLFIPETIGKRKKVICVIDSSGSTSDKWKDFLTEVVAIAKNKTEVYLVQIDAKIQSVEKITTVPKKLVLKGGGGTDFKEFFEFEWLKKVKIKRWELKDVVIFFFTDLAAYGIPETCPKEINPNKFYWILIEPAKIPWGKKIEWWRL